VREAQAFTWQTLDKAYRPGMGQSIPDRLFWARDDAPMAVDDDAETQRRQPDARGGH
jgi:hydroxymethylpyrimidine/phosphomethylpyrimidine kinase